MTERIWLNSLLAAILIGTPVAFAQPVPSIQQTPSSSRLEFEAASIRQNVSNSYITGNLDLDSSDYFRYPGGLVTASGSLTNYIIFAYKIEDTSQYPRIQAQLPKWAQTQRFYLEARPNGSPTKDQLRLMVRSLLADRFRLALHTEIRQLPAYAITLDKPGIPGPQLLPHPDDALCTKISDKPASKPPGPIPPPWCGLMLWSNNGLTHMRIMAHTMPQIAGELTTVGVQMGGIDPLPLLDQTGLIGRFDIDLEFLREPRKPPPPGADSEPEPTGPTFAEALRKQAGLKLAKQAGPVTTFVIDHVEPLSEN